LAGYQPDVDGAVLTQSIGPALASGQNYQAEIASTIGVPRRTSRPVSPLSTNARSGPRPASPERPPILIRNLPMNSISLSKSAAIGIEMS
jgi:hypothetical protein